MASEIKSVLVVDDEEDLTWSISRYLKRNGQFMDVRCVNSGDEALQVLLKERIDLIISDIRMPGTDGLALLGKVMEHWPETRVIIMTAYGSEILEQEVMHLGSPYYIEKPFELHYLRKLVFEALELSENRMQGMLLSAHVRDILAFNCQTRRTSEMTVENGRSRGLIYLHKGEIVHAECGDLEGENALYSILDWGKANFQMNPDKFSKKRTIRRKWQSLLNATMID